MTGSFFIKEKSSLSDSTSSVGRRFVYANRSPHSAGRSHVRPYLPGPSSLGANWNYRSPPAPPSPNRSGVACRLRARDGHLGRLPRLRRGRNGRRRAGRRTSTDWIDTLLRAPGRSKGLLRWRRGVRCPNWAVVNDPKCTREDLEGPLDHRRNFVLRAGDGQAGRANRRRWNQRNRMRQSRWWLAERASRPGRCIRAGWRGTRA